MFKSLRNKTSLPPIDPKAAEYLHKKYRIKAYAWSAVMFIGVLFWFFFCFFILHLNS